MSSKLKTRVGSLPVVGRLARSAYRGVKALPATVLGRHPQHSKRRINLMNEFPAYAPASLGSFKQLEDTTREGIKGLFPAIAVLLERADLGRLDITHLADFQAMFPVEPGESAGLKALLDHYGSDKASKHDYHILYSSVLGSIPAVRGLLEIGLGSNNSDVLSHMGRNASPGASLRAFRDFLPQAQIFGADIDRRILFSEERIETFQADQMDLRTMDALERLLPNHLDVIIDDGLHAPLANVQTLAFAIGRVREGGWVIVEDIPRSAFDFWAVVGPCLQRTHFDVYYVETRSADVFAARRRPAEPCCP